MALTQGQQQCVDTLDRPLVVAAGAGSGKTFTLTKRIVGALQSGFIGDIGEVCAITFTRKAAAELKSRIKGELRACNLIEQALKVDDAWVSTIHGMCARILRAHAIQLGIDPSFKVAEGAQVQGYLDRAVDAVLADARARGRSQDVDALFDEYPARSTGGFGTSVESMLHQLVEAASAQADGTASFVLPGVTVAPAAIVQQATELVEGVLASAEAEKAGVKRDAWMARAQEQVEAARRELDAGVTEYPQAFSIVAPLKLEKTFGSKEFKAQVEEARCLLGALVMEARLGAGGEHLRTLVRLAEQALGEYRRLKREDGALDNSDLLVMAARALEDNPSIAARYSDTFKLVMVDEFQDTDQMQVDMIKRLAGPGACRLCTVGDAQQSIYRFRGADVSVYRRHLESVRSQGAGSVIMLSQNFRSHPDVLSFVDCVFQRPGMFGGEFMSLAPGRDESRVQAPFPAERNRIVMQHTSRPWRGVTDAEAGEIAARRIARAFAAFVQEGRSAGEMVVLLGRMTNADVYARALREEGLPCVISGGSVFSGLPEPGIVRELVRVIANPHETQSLFNVLTSPLFALSAGDLLRAGGLSGFLRMAGSDDGAPDGSSPQLECALRVMAQVRALSGIEPVHRIVERAVVYSGWLSRLESSGAEGLASASNVYKAIRMVRSVEEGGAFGPVSVMRRFEEALDGSKEAPGALSVSGGSSVRIMTVHASKGLEFPIVAVADIPVDKAPTGSLLSASVGGKVYLSLDLGRTVRDSGSRVDLDAVGGYVLGDVAGEDGLARAVTADAGSLHRRLALRSYLATGDAEERKRLLYVALTRAREALVVSTKGARTKDNPGGIPSSALAGVFEALRGGGDLGEGRTVVDFGGMLPAVVECVALEAESPAGEGGTPPEGEVLEREHGECMDDAGARGDGDAREPFMVPAGLGPVFSPDAWRPLHEGVFSYSSIAEAAHATDVLGMLASRHVVSVDPPAGDLDSNGAHAVGGGGDDDRGSSVDVWASDFDEDPWSLDASAAFDQDRATDLGTAFHRLAQYAVQARGATGGLACPPTERIEALSRTCNLDSLQRGRLRQALERWFGCQLARDMQQLPKLSAEVPFFVAVDGGREGDVFLEGEIDLLGYDESGSGAFVVDYKTGGRDDEAVEDLQQKHVLQAACYAYAIMLQGASRVDAVFARVERARGDDPTQPQCVRYRFQASDLPELERAIARVYAASR